MGKVVDFIKRHRRDEETIATSAIVTVAWRALAVALGAGIAGAALTLTQSGPTYHPQYSLSQKGSAFIVRNEGLRLTPYNDPFNCTVGVGHLIHMGPCTASDYARWKITYPQAITLLLHDSTWAVNCVREHVTHPINQAQFDALVDFTFNIGCGGLQQSSVLRDVNAGKNSSIRNDLARYSYASGHFLPGLYTRRMAEADLYLHNYYGPGIGYYIPRPITVAEKLRAKTGYWSWLSWRLGEGAWKPFGKANPKVRPNVPTVVPKVWWNQLALFLKARHA